MNRKIELIINENTNLDALILDTSRHNPTCYIYVYCRLGKCTIYINSTMPRTDCAGTLQTFAWYGGFFKNAKIVQPGKLWFKAKNFIPARE